MKTLLAAGALLLILTLLGCIQNNTNTENPLEGVDEGVVPGMGKLVAGAACEVDEDCVYALNAYPTQECISQNCPPEDQPQPEWGDPNYEWKETYLDECVNAAQLNGKNLQGEELLIDSRAAACACQPIQLANTSLDGQKICRKKMVEETPEEELVETTPVTENTIEESALVANEDAPTPTACTLLNQDYRYYFSEKIMLHVATNQIVLGFNQNTDNGDILEVMEKAGQSEYEKSSLLAGKYFLIDLPTCLTLEELELLIDRINAVPGTHLDFAGKVYHNEDGEFAKGEMDVLLVKRKGPATEFETYLEERGVEIIEANFAGMEGVYKLDANARTTGVSPQTTANQIYEDGMAEWSETDGIMSGGGGA